MNNILNISKLVNKWCSWFMPLIGYGVRGGDMLKVAQNLAN